MVLGKKSGKASITYNLEQMGITDADDEAVSEMLKRVKGRIVARRLTRVSPLAVPVMLDIGKESVPGEAHESLLRDSAEELIAEAMRVG